MRNISRLLLVPLVIAAQVAFQVPIPATASAADSAAVVGTKPNVVISLTTTAPSLLEVKTVAPKPNFDSEVLAPLRAEQQAKADAEAKAAAEAEAARIAAAQAAAAAAARAAAIRLAAARTAPVYGANTGDAWYQLRMCEAGNDYTRNSGNGYYGAYQYNLGTWGNYMGYARPDLAPPDVQDAKARETQAARGWSPWPACARKLGLL